MASITYIGTCFTPLSINRARAQIVDCGDGSRKFTVCCGKGLPVVDWPFAAVGLKRGNILLSLALCHRRCSLLNDGRERSTNAFWHMLLTEQIAAWCRRQYGC
jgi:hypothetical protein